MKGEALEVEVQLERVSVPLPAGIWSETGPEIDIDAVMYSAVGSVNSKKSSNILPEPGVLVLGNETLSFRIEPRFWTLIVVAWAADEQTAATPSTASDLTSTLKFMSNPHSPEGRFRPERRLADLWNICRGMVGDATIYLKTIVKISDAS